MRINAFILFLTLLINTPIQAQKSVENENIANFCKIWGFLKYHHPIVAQGDINWDNEFVNGIKIISELKEKRVISDYYIQWIEKLGRVEKCNNCPSKFDKKEFFLKNYDLSWLRDTTVFSRSLIKVFDNIRKNRNQRKNFYADQGKPYGTLDFSNELVYPDSLYPSKEFRLLTLSRYWNIIEYFYPYKYKIDEDWDAVLETMIPLFLEAKDTMDYHIAIHKLVAKIDDTHAGIMDWTYLRKFLGTKNPPFVTKIVNDSIAIVSNIINDSLCRVNNIEYGDAIYTIDNQTITKQINDLAPYFSSSNQASKKRDIARNLLFGHSDSIQIKYERDGRIMKQYIKRYPISVLASKKTSSRKQDLPTQILTPHNIGYINMGTLQKKDTKRIMKKMMKTQAIIFDVRNYPQGTILRIIPYLYPKPIRPMTSIFPMATAPGIFYKKQLMSFGKQNEEYYKGKIFILINEETQSHAETTAILLRAAPQALLIGSQTAGSDGRVTKFKLPGDIETIMTGEGIIIPDIQRNGIIPDIEIKPTIEGMRNHEDEVLKKAIELAK